jgi:flagellar hook-associated protein 1 FlgK
MGLSIGLDTAVKALRAHQVAVDTSSHNIANANTEGFSRQRVLLRPIGVDGSDHFTRDALLGRVGFGVDAHDVNRVRDIFLDFQARQAISAHAEWDAHSTALGRTEMVFNEPSDDGLAAIFTSFWNGWHDLTNDPESSAARTTVVNAGLTLGARLRRAYSDLFSERGELDRQVVGVADRINAAASEIASVNFQIKQVELAGDKANDLRDRRDLLLDQLSKIANVTYTEQQDKTVTVYLGSHELVTANQARVVTAVADPANVGMSKLMFVVDSADVLVSSGELHGLIDVRDNKIPGLISRLNTLAGTMITQLNTLHAAGFGLDGTTGLNFFTGTDAQTIDVNGLLVSNPEKIAAATVLGAAGNGANSLAIADLQHALTMVGNTQSFGQFYTNTVGMLGADISRAKGLAESGKLLLNHIDGQRQSVSGVNIDEEVNNLTQSQKAYQAAARVISVIDEMLDTLINRTAAH